MVSVTKCYNLVTENNTNPVVLEVRSSKQSHRAFQGYRVLVGWSFLKDFKAKPFLSPFLEAACILRLMVLPTLTSTSMAILLPHTHSCLPHSLHEDLCDYTGPRAVIHLKILNFITSTNSVNSHTYWFQKLVCGY